MAQSRDVKVVLVGEDRASKTFDKVGKASGGLSGMIGKLGSAVPVAGAAVAGLAVGVLKVGGAFIETSSRLEALAAKSKTVFGDQLGTVNKWAKANAAAMKLTSSEAVGLATDMADLLIPMGFTRKAAADMATKSIGLSGALSKWSGGTVAAADAAGILTDAMLGETDGLKALGISISAAEIDAELLAKKQDKLTGAALAQAQAQATQNLIFAKSTDAQKGFASGTQTLADRLENLKVKMRGAWEQLVVRLTPAATRFADYIATKGAASLAKFADYLQRNRDRFLQMGAAALTGAGNAMRAIGNLAFSFGKTMSTMLFGMAGVANALGQKGLARDLNKAAGESYLMGVMAKAAGDKAAAAFTNAATALNGIKSKTVTITTITRGGQQATGRGAVAGDGGPRMPKAAPRAPSRNVPSRTVAGSSLMAQPVQIVLDGRVLAESTRAVLADDRLNGRNLQLA